MIDQSGRRYVYANERYASLRTGLSLCPPGQNSGISNSVALKCEYSIYTDSVDTVEKRGLIWPSTAISDVLALI